MNKRNDKLQSYSFIYPILETERDFASLLDIHILSLYNYANTPSIFAVHICIIFYYIKTSNTLLSRIFIANKQIPCVTVQDITS